MQDSTAMKLLTGRAASRARRAQLVQGKTGLPPAAERSRTGNREAAILAADAAVSTSPAPRTEIPATAPARVASKRGTPMALAGRRITGTLFSGDEPDAVECTGGYNRVTGDTPRNVARVTGTQRGAERDITGTPYYRANCEGEMKTNVIEHVANAFTVRSPQLDSQLRADAAATRRPSAESRITGTFARGEGKITGNQEFHFSPRPKSDDGARTQVTGEGRVQGPKVTGSAWDVKPNVTGTEDYIAAERNPSERAGQPHGFANSKVFKGKGKHPAPTHHVSGMVGWSPKTAARVTVSGGAQG